MSSEREVKVIAAASLRIPDLRTVEPGVSVAELPVRHLAAVYYDTADLDLARWGITLRHRFGEPGRPWTLKLPGGSSGPLLVRPELGFEGQPWSVPVAAHDLLTAYVRARPLVDVAHLRTERSPLEVRDASGQRLLELVDDRVTAHRGNALLASFREIEVEVLVPGERGDRLANDVVARLVAAGGRADPAVPKVVRALGPGAVEPPELTVPAVGPDSQLGLVVRHALARSVIEVIRHDAGVRLGEDPDELRLFGIAARRLRSDLGTFGSLFEPERVRELPDELRWLISAVGPVLDAHGLGRRLRGMVPALSDPDDDSIELLLSLLARHTGRARTALLDGLRRPRYVALVDVLVQVGGEPAVRGERTANAALSFVRRPWRRLRDEVVGHGGDPLDRAVPQLRSLTEVSLYAVEAVKPVVGPQASGFAAALGDLLAVLDDQRDALVTETWLGAVAAKEPATEAVADELVRLQESRRPSSRARWSAAWDAVSARSILLGRGPADAATRP